MSTRLRGRECDATPGNVDWNLLVPLGIDEQQFPALAQLIDWKDLAVESDQRSNRCGYRVNRGLALQGFENPATNVCVERRKAGLDGHASEEDYGLIRADVGLAILPSRRRFEAGHR